MIRITSFAKAKENATQGNTNGYANNTTNVTVTRTGVNGVNIWGQYHDHTADISGDMSNVGNISASGNIVTSGDIQGKNITATNHIQTKSITTETLENTGNANIGGQLTVDGNLNASNIYAVNGTFTGDLSSLDFFSTNGEITNLNTATAIIENLTVTKAAHFYKLIIDEIKATQGQIIVTPANAEIVDVQYNSADGGIYSLSFLANDGEKEITNGFAVNDQILCQTFNAAEGTTYDASNKFYWARCSSVSSAPVAKTINGQEVMCHYIMLQWSDRDPNSNGVPEVGDEIVMLGNRTDATRQNAITIGAYNNPYLDNAIKAPFIIQYAGINDYNLSTHRKNVISNGYNMFNGSFTTTAGDNIEDLINQIGEGALTFIHIAYASSADGSLNFNKSYFTDAAYMGICSNHTESDTALIYSDYTWVRIKGNDGDNGEGLKLIPLMEQAPIDKNGTVGLYLQYNIMKVSGETYETMTATSSLAVYYKAYYENNAYINTYSRLSIDTQTPTYTNTSLQTNYNDPNTKKILYIEVILSNSNPDMTASGNVIYDRRVVYPSMTASATFEITDEIKLTVQDHKDLIDGMENNISQITQKADSIESTVSSHTTQIDKNTQDIGTVTGLATTNTSNITSIIQRADSIESTVSSHTTSINQNTTDIASLKLTAEEIKSEVSSYNASTENLFNFSYCKWSNAIPFIQGYGIEGTGNVARISNLGFDGEGGDFVVTCQMRMQNATANINVNMCDKEAEDNQSTQTVTTTWKSFSFKFKGIQQYIGGTSETTTSYNGYIDFEGASTSNRLYIRRLMINRGNIAIAWGVSSKDLEVYKDEENIITEWTLNKVAEGTEKYKGYKTYKTTTAPTAGNQIDYIYKDDLELEENTPYTLTFYARTDGDMIIASYLTDCVDGTYLTGYTQFGNGETTEMNSTYGTTYSRIGTEVRKYTIHWYNQNSGTRKCIVARVHGDWATDNTSKLIEICGMELRKGYWTEEQSNSNSLIRQTANEIELKVKDTGINIEDGTITLNANNTTINGNLNLKNNQQGVIIYDDYGNPKITIQNETLGTLDDFDFGADKQLKAVIASTISNTSYSVTFPTISLGTFTAGQKLQLHDIYVNSFHNANVFNTDLVTLSYVYTIYCGSTQVTSVNGNAEIDDFNIKLNDLNYNLTLSGNYTLNLTINGMMIDTALFGQWTHRCTLYVRSIQTNINKIAADGAVFASSTNQFNWFGKDQTIIRNGNQALRVKDGKIQRNVYDTTNVAYSSTFGDISSTLPYDFVNELRKTATLDDCVIIFSSMNGELDSAQRTLYLPHPSECTGKMYIIRNVVGNNTKVYVDGATTDNLFLPSNSNTAVSNISIGSSPTILVSGMWAWMQLYCG